MSDTATGFSREPVMKLMGTVVGDALTASEAVTAAGLDWTVSKKPLLVKLDENRKRVVPNWFATVRDTDDQPLGVVKSHYTPLQNRDAFGFADALVAEGEARFILGAQLHEGRQIMLVAELAEGLTVAGSDEVKLNLMLRSSHDGSRGLGVYITAVNQTCMNQTELITETALQRWSAAHVSTLEGKMTEAKHALQLVDAYRAEFEDTAKRLTDVQVELDEFRALLSEVLPQKPRTEGVIDRIAAGLEDSKHITDELRWTGWGALNAVTEYYDHVRPARSAEARFRGAVGGTAARTRNLVAQRLLVR